VDEQWVPIADSSDVTTVPWPVEVAGRAYVAVRLAEDAPATLVAGLCPHRLVPLSAATVDRGRLRCAYHGWEFDRTGACVQLPSLGPDAHIPPRAHLAPAPRAKEEDGRLWACVSDLPTAGADLPTAGADLPSAGAEVDGLCNTDPRLRKAWHPVALVDEIGAEPYDAMVVGLPYTLRRVDGVVLAEPAPAGLTERWGVLWLAPQPPRTELFPDPDVEDAAYAGAWLPPVRTGVNAGFVADNFLDVAHFPFVHIGTFGASAERVVEPADVVPEPDGFRSVQVQWFDNPGDRGVEAGIRSLRQRRRATYVYRAPFQLLLRLEELDTESVKTILFLALPETDTSTRIYTKMLLHNIGGELRPGPETVAREVEFEEAVLAEDLALQSVVTIPGLPLDMRTELHVKADRHGVALRRELSRFLDG
jgi:phenylpropionate dioxygenase-like ring-hydroxylating dioxygenase large terminal subunit